VGLPPRYPYTHTNRLAEISVTLTPTVAVRVVSTAIKDSVPGDRVKPSFVIFDIQTLRPGLAFIDSRVVLTVYNKFEQPLLLLVINNFPNATKALR